MTMPNDNQAKSYIATVLARADAVKPLIERGLNSNGREYQLAQGCIPVCLDSQTLAKIALRAIAALEEYDDASEFPSNLAAKALADINALAAKGSQ